MIISAISCSQKNPILDVLLDLNTQIRLFSCVAISNLLGHSKFTTSTEFSYSRCKHVLASWIVLQNSRRFLISSILPLREKCPNTEFFLVCIFLYSVQMQENTDHKKLWIWTLFMQCTRYSFTNMLTFSRLKLK